MIGPWSQRVAWAQNRKAGASRHLSAILLCCLFASFGANSQPIEPGLSAVPISSHPLRLSMRQAKPLSRIEEQTLEPLDMFKECPVCPEMIVVPSGEFTMGAPESEPYSEDNERPLHKVTIAKSFTVGRFAVTFEEWDACIAEHGCRNYRPLDRWGRGRQPVINLWWDDAKAYAKWLSDKTGKSYRLLSESEREYVTRAGTTTPFWWGSSISTDQANYDGAITAPQFGNSTMAEFRRKTVPVDTFIPNPWGLYQVHGNVYEWVEDCWHSNYEGAPTDGSSWTILNCDRHIVRGGAWNFAPWQLRSGARGVVASAVRLLPVGVRVARDR